MVVAAAFRIMPWADEELGVTGNGNWDECAKVAGVSDRTVLKWRTERTGEWDKAVSEAWQGLRGQAMQVGLRRLVTSAEGEPGSAGITAANSLLGHVGEIVPQKHEHSGPDGGPIQMVTPEMLALMATREASEQEVCDGGDDAV
jgi:hypothetical protein